MVLGLESISSAMHEARSFGPFDYHQPNSLDGVIELLQEHGPDAALLAGGTALLIDMRHRELAPKHLISLWSIEGFGDIVINGELKIGARATLTSLIKVTRERAPLAGLTEASLTLGSRQIQNVATVAGNICKASPGADLVPPLLCLDAMLALQGPDGPRIAPLDGFLTGPDQTALKPAEVVREIQVPQTPARTGTAFHKIMRRQALDCSIISVAARVTLEDDGETCRVARIGIAAAAPNPFRAKEAEESLKGKVFSSEQAREAGRMARGESNPIDDVRASAEYRRLMVEELTTRALEDAYERARAT